jgi:diaminopimelate decarboxylase
MTSKQPSTQCLATDDSRLRPILPDTFRVDDDSNCVVGGCRLDQLAQRFGTPLYVYCEDTMRSVCREFVSAFTGAYERSHIEFSSKAFPHPAIARLVIEEGLYIDVVSGGELAVALKGGVPAAPELREALAAGVSRVTVDSFRELDLLNELAGERGVRQCVSLRLSPNVDAHTHLLTTTGLLDSKFGFTIPDAAEEAIVYAMRKCAHLHVVGVHFHLGSPLFEIEPYVQAIEFTLAFAARVRAAHGFELLEFSPGAARPVDRRIRARDRRRHGEVVQGARAAAAAAHRRARARRRGACRHGCLHCRRCQARRGCAHVRLC